MLRSSPQEVFFVLKICSKFTGEHPCRSVISIKLQSNFEIHSSARVFSYKFASYFKNTFSKEHFWQAAFGCFWFYNTSQKFWDQSSFPHYQCCLQVSETVSWHKRRRCYSSNMLQHWGGGKDLIYFCKVDHSRICINSSRNWLRLNNLFEILSQNLT